MYNNPNSSQDILSLRFRAVPNVSTVANIRISNLEQSKNLKHFRTLYCQIRTAPNSFVKLEQLPTFHCQIKLVPSFIIMSNVEQFPT